MCSYCGCRSITVIADLTRNHEEENGVFPAAVIALDGPRWDAVEAAAP